MQAASKLTEEATPTTEVPNEEPDGIALENSEPLRATTSANNGDSHAAASRPSSPISLGGWTWPIPRPNNNKA